MSELAKASEGVFEALVACLPNDEAADRIGAKPVMVVDVYRRLMSSPWIRSHMLILLRTLEVRIER